MLDEFIYFYQHAIILIEKMFRVEFENFRLAQPNANTTICDEDYFTAVGGATPIPKLCGDAYNDQHRTISINCLT